MKPAVCESAWSARACHDCAHNPDNQRDPRGEVIRPPVSRSGRCPQWRAVRPEVPRRA